MKRLSKEERIQRIKDYWPYFVIGLILFVPALGIFLYSLFAGGIFVWMANSILLAPGIIMLMIWRFKKRHSEKQWKMIVGSIIMGLGLLFFFGTVYIAGYFLIQIPQETCNNIGFYRPILDILSDNQLDYFPVPIPDTAENPKFHYSSHHTHIKLTLQYTTTSQEIALLEEQLRSQAICMGKWEPDKELRQNAYGDCDSEDVYRLHYATSWMNFEEHSYEVYLIDTSQYDPRQNAADLGFTGGVAINRNDSIVLYWAAGYMDYSRLSPLPGLDFP